MCEMKFLITWENTFDEWKEKSGNKLEATAYLEYIMQGRKETCQNVNSMGNHGFF